MLVSHILDEKGHDVVVVQPDATLVEASMVLNKNRIGALLVLDRSNALKGIISERDIVRALADGGSNAVALTVAACMTKDIATCTENTTIEEIMETMTRYRFRHMPVVKNGRVTGIVSIGDIVKTRIAETIDEAQALKKYIATA
jgi:CBS domain-containing protein